MTIVHINTELRLAWRKGVEEGLRKEPDEVASRKIMRRPTTGVRSGERTPDPVQFELTKVLLFRLFRSALEWIVGLPPYGTRLAKKRARWVFIILGVFLISLKPVLTI
jgi:hypothetical protein